MSRTPLVCGNWKMNLTSTEAADFAADLLARLAELPAAPIELAIAPAHPVLDRLGRALAGSDVALAAQNLHAEEAGAFTGEVSLAMLVDLGCRYALIGHSERRQLFGEHDLVIAFPQRDVHLDSLSPIEVRMVADTKKIE